ncbi:MAG TPA: rhomboid family intramembrane serine protease [Gammaproteobacteria bacterium]|nr:rhomboid family intramembrane serine protease [Gammaproteobacteria bacterium]
MAATFDEVVARVSRWAPGNPLLVAAPGATRFLPPAMIPELAKVARDRIARFSRNLIILLSSAGVIHLLSALLFFADLAGTKKAVPVALGWGLMFLGWAALLAMDARHLRTADGMSERALFLHWLTTSRQGKHALWFWLAVMVAAGVSQLVSLQLLGGSEKAVFHQYGVMYGEVREGEYWRLLTGPWLHYSLQHYLINTALALFAGMVASALFGHAAFVVFLLANTVSAAAQMGLGGDAFNNFGGVSGGVYALCGLVAAAGLGRRRLLPKGFPVFWMGIAVIGVIASELLSETAATTAHVTGLLVGVLAAPIVCGLPRRACEEAR